MTNKPNKIAVALKYDKEKSNAPKVIATGKGYVADKIIDGAIEENITVHKDEDLANELSLIEVGREIPEELYEVVAAVFVFIKKIDGIY